MARRVKSFLSRAASQETAQSDLAWFRGEVHFLLQAFVRDEALRRAQFASLQLPATAGCPTVWSRNLVRLVSWHPQPTRPSPTRSSQQSAAYYRFAGFLESLTGLP